MRLVATDDVLDSPPLPLTVPNAILSQLTCLLVDPRVTIITYYGARTTSAYVQVDC